MKIVIVGQMLWYGSVSRWTANAWEYLGHDVERFEYFNLDKIPKKADIYFFCDVSTDFSEKIPKDINGIKIFWAMDVQMPLGLERSVNIARKCDFTFTTNKQWGEDLLKKFDIDCMWVPYGYDYILQKKILDKMEIKGIGDFKRTIPCEYDVCMIGHPNSLERVKLWKLLLKKYGDKAVVGTIANENEYINKKAKSSIMISQPTEPYNMIINLRVWNALACKKLLLCKTPTISEHSILGLKDGINVIYWNNFDDLIEKIDYFLKNPNKAQKIANEGFKLGCKHLMINQVRIMEQVIYSKFYNKFIY